MGYGVFAKDRIDEAIEWIVIISFFIGNLIIAKYLLSQVKDYIFIGSLVLILPLYFINVWNSRREYFKCDFLCIVLGIFFILVAISALLSAKKYIGDGHIGSVLVLASGVFLFYHIRALGNIEKERVLMKFIGVFFITGILQSLMGMAQFFFDKDVHGIYKTLVTGTLINPNLYGGYICISLAAGCVLLYKNRTGKSRYFYMASLVIMISTLLLCRSRGAILSLLLSAGLIVSYYFYTVCFKHSLTDRRKILGVFVVGAIVSTSVFIFLDKSSSQGRVMKTLIGYSMVRDNPFIGIGYGRYADIYPAYQADFLNKEQNRRYIERANEDGTTNNQYLKFLIEFGIVGLSVFLFLIFLIFRIILTSNYIEGKNPYNLFIVFSIFSITFHMFFDETLRFSVMAFIFPLLCAYVPSGENLYVGKGSALVVIRKTLSIIVIITLLILSVLYLRQYQTIMLTARAKLFLSGGDFSNAVFFAQRALDFNPLHTPAKIILGRSKIGLGGVSETQISEGIAILQPVRLTSPSRDIYLALSVGYLKTCDLEHAYEYAHKAHKLLPNQIRPKIMLYLLDIATAKEGAFLMLESDFKIVSSHPVQAQIASLVELVGRNQTSDFLHLPQAIQLVDLIMLAH